VTFVELVVHARESLIRAGISPATAAFDADLLARHARGWDRASWLARRLEPADSRFELAFAALVARRCAREPAAYIRGIQEFWGREFVVTPDVLSPRPETELVVETALTIMREQRDLTLVDVGTGSGCIAITLALERPDARIWATDVSEGALRIARENAGRLGAAERVTFIHGPFSGGVRQPIHLIVSNPPYVRERDRSGLAPEVVDYEPAVALFGGDDGLREVRALLRHARDTLASRGHLVMEIGFDQGPPIERELRDLGGLSLEAIHEDLQGIPRVVVAQRQGQIS
jgi:release factor glutamine methyltransferase